MLVKPQPLDLVGQKIMVKQRQIKKRYPKLYFLMRSQRILIEINIISEKYLVNSNGPKIRVPFSGTDKIFRGIEMLNGPNNLN